MKHQYLAIDAFGSDHLNHDSRPRKPAEDPNESAANGVAPFERLKFTQAVTQADKHYWSGRLTEHRYRLEEQSRIGHPAEVQA